MTDYAPGDEVAVKGTIMAGRDLRDGCYAVRVEASRATRLVFTDCAHSYTSAELRAALDELETAARSLDDLPCGLEAPLARVSAARKEGAENAH